MNKRFLRYYAMGLIGIIMAANIPEVKQIIEDKVMIAEPRVRSALQLTYNNVSAAVVPLIGKIIDKPQLYIDGKAIQVDTEDNFSLTHGQSLDAKQIDLILQEAKSPGIGTGSKWVSIGSDYKIDAAYALAIFIHESSAGTNLGAARKPDGTWTYNIGNLICSGFDPNHDGKLDCNGNFRDYSAIDGNAWYNGIEGTIQNLAYYRDKMGIKTFREAIQIWAPPSENNTALYIEQSENLIRTWRSTNKNILTKDAQAISAPITIDPSNDFGYNVKSALDANNQALRNVYIRNGEQWSFNETIGDEANTMKLKNIAGIPGGGWCDLACRYVQVLKGLGLRINHSSDINSGQIVFLQHGGYALINCTVEESPFIWSNGQKGFNNSAQDLIVNNNTGKTIQLTVIDNADTTATVIGKLL